MVRIGGRERPGSDGNETDGDGCDSNCTETGCGNGIVTAGEACDDGNTSNEDRCLNGCVLPTCGDGSVQLGVEDCDPGLASLSVNSACLPGCIAAACRDGLVWQGQEECDDGNSVNGDGCENDCTITKCGNGQLDPGEDCDPSSPDTPAPDNPNATCQECRWDCDAGYGDCNGLIDDGCETDVTSNEDHCAACENDCGGAACNAGICEAIDLTTGSSVELDQTYLYTYQSGVRRMPKNGGTVDVLYQAPFGVSGRLIGIDASSVYFVQESSGFCNQSSQCTLGGVCNFSSNTCSQDRAILKLAKDGLSPAEVLVGGLNPIASVHAFVDQASAQLYYPEGTSLQRVSTSTGSVQNVLQQPNLGMGFGGFQRVGNEIYVAMFTFLGSGGEIWRRDENLGSPAVLHLAHPNPIYSMRHDNVGYFYLANTNLERVPDSGVGAPEIVALGGFKRLSSVDQRVVAASGNVDLVELRGGPSPTVSQVLYSGISPTNFRGDGTGFVYFVDGFPANQIKKLRLPPLE